MGKVVNINKIDTEIEKLKTNGGMWKIKNGSYAIKHLEVERLAKLYNIQTNIELKHCDLTNGCAVVKAVATYQDKNFYSFGEVSPQNNDFEYPLAVAEKRAADRAILKALGIHGNVYSAEELPNIKNNNNENNNTSTDQGDIILEKIKTITHQGNLEELKSKNKKFLNDIKKKNLLRFQELKQAFLNREQQLTEG